MPIAFKDFRIAEGRPLHVAVDEANEWIATENITVINVETIGNSAGFDMPL